jgi:carbon-monoxide dehydrogenase catalytic subunit
MAGCNSTKNKSDEYHNVLTKELIKNNVLVLQTGCAALTSAKAGMLKPEVAYKYAGDSLKEVCETVGIPPVRSGSGRRSRVDE